MTPPQPSTPNSASSRAPGRRSPSGTAGLRSRPAASRMRDALRRDRRTRRVASELERWGTQAGNLRSRAERVVDRVRRLV